jgi:hypothetical protein
MQAQTIATHRSPIRGVDASKARHIREIEQFLVPAKLKFFTLKAFGFVIPDDGKDYFIHVANCRFVEKDGSLRRPAMNEVTKDTLGLSPNIRIIPGEGRDGRPAALLWTLHPLT